MNPSRLFLLLPTLLLVACAGQQRDLNEPRLLAKPPKCNVSVHIIDIAGSVPELVVDLEPARTRGCSDGKKITWHLNEPHWEFTAVDPMATTGGIVFSDSPAAFVRNCWRHTSNKKMSCQFTGTPTPNVPRKYMVEIQNGFLRMLLDPTVMND